MHRKRRYLAYIVLALIDVALIVASYLLSCVLYQGSLHTLGGLVYLNYAGGIPAAMWLVFGYAFIVAVVYAVSSVYGFTYIGRIGAAVGRVFAINTLGLIAASAFFYVAHLDDVSRITLVIFYAISTVVVSVKCWVSYRIFLLVRSNRKRIQRTVVVGDGALAERYVHAIKSNTSRLEEIIGVVTPNNVVEDGKEFKLAKNLGNVANLQEILEAANAEKMVIAIEPSEYHHINAIMAAADKFGLELELIPFYNDIMPRRPDIDSVDDVRMVNLRSMSLSNPLNAAVKRGADIVVSGAIIVAFCWLYAAVAIGVKASSPGPVLFKQRRIGKNNKEFEMLKFRSMRVNADSDTAWSTDEDPRKTKFGSFIRKFSLDEFPQFFNVFIGDMSIVGPRPEIPHYVEEFREDYSRYMLRHQVRPGITGWAQVNGLRGDTSISKRIDADLWYIEHWSPLLDTKIFFRTLFGGFVNSEKLVK